MNRLDKSRQIDYQKAWWKTFNILMNGIKLLIFLIAGALLYIPFGKHLDDWLEPQAIYEATEQRLDAEDDFDKVENGIHVQTGLIYAKGFDQVRANCTVCHSAKLVTQNRATREGWEQMITWMQEKQGLWELGKNKTIILDYLASHYAPIEKGRRDHLDIAEIEWYILELE